MRKTNEQTTARTLELMKRDMPKLVNGFAGLQAVATANAALDAKTKALTAFAIGVMRGNETSIARHANAAFNQGATEAEMLESIGMAMLLGGEPASFNGGAAFEIVEQVVAERTNSAN